MILLLQGTFAGVLFSVLFTAWIAIGRNVAQSYGYSSADHLLKNTTTESCPIHLLNNMTSVTDISDTSSRYNR